MGGGKQAVSCGRRRKVERAKQEPSVGKLMRIECSDINCDDCNLGRPAFVCSGGCPQSRAKLDGIALKDAALVRRAGHDLNLPHAICDAFRSSNIKRN